MLRAVLKILAYLSILTSTRTSSSYLEPQSLVSYRRANAAAVATGAVVPSSIDVNVGIPSNVQQFSDLSPDTIDGADVYDVQWRASNSPYFMPRLVNANSMLYTQLSSNNNKNINNNNNNNFNNNLNNNNNNNLNSNSNNNNNNNNNNNRRGSKKSRKSKKQQQESRINSSSSKQFYETHSKRRNSFSTPDIDDTNDQSSSLQSSSSIDIQNHSNNNLTSATAAKINNFTSNEYPPAQVDGKLERELQELFGIEGARKYQEYQLQQQIMNEQYGKIPEKTDLKETQRKRDGGLGAAEEMQDVSGAMINQMMSRTTRRQREYDVPLIQCPPATDGMERFACPTPDRQGRYRCIDDHVLCDGFIDCPEGADEDRQACMFYKTTKAHLDVLADALLRWARGR
ncbi:putative mediator of RNA polymerase II transcription subunit 29 [Chironomus tepperi]|uniref:putative mediator of RNA polymerase II transcription subunit 29 n=1 Tax=Chironomus tepperi TaxID=113505 RepID=UPI00391F71BB